jgi:hypothetical protein
LGAVGVKGLLLGFAWFTGLISDAPLPGKGLWEAESLPVDFLGGTKCFFADGTRFVAGDAISFLRLRSFRQPLFFELISRFAGIN